MAFIVGLILLVGFKGTIAFFTKKGTIISLNLIGKIRGSIVFFVGFLSILILRFTIIGFGL